MPLKTGELPFDKTLLVKFIEEFFKKAAKSA
jgi:hypothetical protein